MKFRIILKNGATVSILSGDISESTLKSRVFTSYIKKHTQFANWEEWSNVLDEKKDQMYVGLNMQVAVNNSEAYYNVQWLGDYDMKEGIEIMEIADLVAERFVDMGEPDPFKKVCFVISFVSSFLM